MNHLKSFIVALAFLFNTGCSTFGAYFDNNEYAALAQMETTIESMHDNCGRPDKVIAGIGLLQYEANYLYVYSSHLKYNTEMHDIAGRIREQVTELSKRYNDGKIPSEAYCSLKLNMLGNIINVTMDAVATQRRT